MAAAAGRLNECQAVMIRRSGGACGFGRRVDTGCAQKRKARDPGIMAHRHSPSTLPSTRYRGGRNRSETRFHRPPYRQFAAPRSHSRSEEHTYELQSLMRTSNAGFCLKKKKNI